MPSIAALLKQEFYSDCNIGTINYFLNPGTYVAMIGPDVNDSIVNCSGDTSWFLTGKLFARVDCIKAATRVNAKNKFLYIVIPFFII